MNGIGATSEKAAFLAACVRPFVKAISQESVIDVGCGGLDFMGRYARNYRGISASCAEVANDNPDLRFDNAQISEIANATYDYAIAFNVFHDSPETVRLDEGLASLIRVCRKGVIFSHRATTPAHQAPAAPSPDLIEALRRHESIKSVIQIGSFDDTTVYIALKQPGLPLSGADATLADIALGCNETEDWKLLLEIAHLSRAKLGFFPKTITRTIEYPWFAKRVETHTHRRVLDIGAGVCALPLWFAQAGLEVVTIDHSQHIRDVGNRIGWNEWGYLDYGQLDERIASHHVDAQYYQPERPFDAIYSVSVIEHMPAAVRRNILSKLPNWLAPGGKVFLSLDLIPNTDQLWPLCEGRHVDLDGRHGAYQDVIAEMGAIGLHVVEISVRRSIAGSGTDLAFIEARKR